MIMTISKGLIFYAVNPERYYAYAKKPYPIHKLGGALTFCNTGPAQYRIVITDVIGDQLTYNSEVKHEDTSDWELHTIGGTTHINNLICEITLGYLHVR